MRGEHRDDVVQLVAVHVVDRHHAAAEAALVAAERLRMIVPRLLVAAGGRLFPPAIRIDDVCAPVAVDVAGADAVSRDVAAIGDVVDRPHRRRIGRIGLRVPHLALGAVHELGLAVAVDVVQDADFRLIRPHHEMLVPAARLTFRIDIQEAAGIDGEAAVQRIAPAVAGEVADELHPGVRRVVIGWIGRELKVDLTASGVVRPVEHVRSGDDVLHVVVIDVGGARSPRVVEVAEPLHPEVARHFLRRPHLNGQVLVRDVLESHLSASTGIQRNRAEIARVGIGDAAAAFAAVVQQGPDDIGIEIDLDRVPLSGLQAGIRRHHGQGHTGRGSASRPTPRSPEGSGRVVERCAFVRRRASTRFE